MRSPYKTYRPRAEYIEETAFRTRLEKVCLEKRGISISESDTCLHVTSALGAVTTLLDTLWRDARTPPPPQLGISNAKLLSRDLHGGSSVLQLLSSSLLGSYCLSGWGTPEGSRQRKQPWRTRATRSGRRSRPSGSGPREGVRRRRRKSDSCPARRRRAPPPPAQRLPVRLVRLLILRRGFSYIRLSPRPPPPSRSSSLAGVGP